MPFVYIQENWFGQVSTGPSEFAISPRRMSVPGSACSTRDTAPLARETQHKFSFPGATAINVICTDHPEVGQFTREQFFSAGSYFDPKARLVNARFQRQGDIRTNPAWVIETNEFRVVARWQITEPPVIAEGTFRPGTEHFTLLFFTDTASVECDGQLIQGQPYTRDIWKASVGGERSSCAFALAESLIEF